MSYRYWYRQLPCRTWQPVSWVHLQTRPCLFPKRAVIGYSSWHPSMTAKLWLTFRHVGWHWLEQKLIDAIGFLFGVTGVLCAARCPLLITSVVGCSWLCVYVLVRQMLNCSRSRPWVGLWCCSLVNLTELQPNVAAAVVCCLLARFVWSLYPQRTDIALDTDTVVSSPDSTRRRPVVAANVACQSRLSNTTLLNSFKFFW